MLTPKRPRSNKPAPIVTLANRSLREEHKLSTLKRCHASCEEALAVLTRGTPLYKTTYDQCVDLATEIQRLSGPWVESRPKTLDYTVLPSPASPDISRKHLTEFVPIAPTKKKSYRYFESRHPQTPRIEPMSSADSIEMSRALVSKPQKRRAASESPKSDTKKHRVWA
ncbi:hypothetical protein NM208_g7069 [Fusarium decemcellulare]|uniref:Uncharacterized protein n=1 Tax=Fusarium decemcellulare TaxID=57161 RepID=A0ACC1SAS0_9HYPO|nr:hypothetical protein NM208_g7069 [Fusarium decemcellulare]